MRSLILAIILGGAFSACQKIPSELLNATQSTIPGYMGYAAESGGVTGGAGGQTVVVTTYAQLKSAAESGPTLIIKVSGVLDGQNTLISVASNKTILGLPGAELHAGGLYMFGTSNVIIQNLKMWAGDPSVNDATGYSAFSVKEGSHHAWIDHCELYPGATDSSTLSHSLGSVTTGADFVTISWTQVHSQYLGLLVGASNIDTTDDVNHLRVTIHHCLFQDVLERQPKVRFGHAHVFNNYYLNAKTSGHTPVGITALCGGIIRTDGNYFQNFNGYPVTTVYDVEDPGFLSGLDTNYKDGTGDYSGVTQTSTWVPPYAYSAYLTPVMNVPNVVLANSGAILK